jgi:hypothetical protein
VAQALGGTGLPTWLHPSSIQNNDAAARQAARSHTVARAALRAA